MRIDRFVTFFMSGAERWFDSPCPFGITWCYLDRIGCGFESHPLNCLSPKEKKAPGIIVVVPAAADADTARYKLMCCIALMKLTV